MSMKIQRYVRVLILVVLLVSFIAINQPVHASTSSVDKLDLRIIDRNFPALQDIIQDQPTVSAVVSPSSVNIGQAARVTVSLNNVPAEGYTSVELTCTYDPNLVEASNIVVASLFGVDPATAINGPQGGRFIVAIAGSYGNKATNSGTVIVFYVRGLQAGQTTVQCTARVPEGNDGLINIESIPASVTVPGGPLTPTIPPAPCDRAEFIADINIPPGTVMAPGTTFTKTWRLTNVGSCTWTTSYELVFFSGELMGAPGHISLNVNVVAGQTVDISLTMIAPSAPGRYRGYWMFKNANGALFGVGPQANEPWFVDIEVSGATPTPTIKPAPCDKAEFIADINIPPGTVMLPATQFTKTWRLKNVGTCTWTISYRIAFFGGEQMGALSSVQFPTNVAPGQAVDLSLNMTAPSTAGAHRGYWIFQNDTGASFGVGPLGNDPWLVDILVSNMTVTPGPTYTQSPAPFTQTPGGPTGMPSGDVAYDFVAGMCTATWFTGVSQLPCPGIDGNANGFVFRVENPELETGATDTRPGLLTFPQNVQNGYIQGFYPPIHIQNGDRFRSTLACEFGATECAVSFRLDYQVGGDPIKTFWGPFHEPYDGRLDSVDVDLSPLAGKDVKFILTVLKPSYRTGDRALWVGPIIYRSDLIATATPTLTPTATYTPAPSSTPPTSSNFIKVTSPNGGEVLMADSTYRITWNSTSDIKTVYIGYKWSNTGMNWIAPGIPNTGYYDWYIGWPAVTQFKIYIYGYGTQDVSDESDDFITILEPTPTVAPSGILTGQVFASKPVTLELYDLDDALITSVPANPDGTFSLTAPAGQYAILASASGHLDTLGSATIIGGITSTQPPTKLLAGDVNGDTYIDQFDALTIGMNYNTSTPAAADLNNDGIINVLDLELLASNYRSVGPIPWQ